MRILAITNLYPRPARATLAPFNRQQFVALASRHDLSIIAPVAWTEELRDWKAGHRVARQYLTPEGIEVRHPRFFFTPRVFRASYGRSFLASIRGGARRQILARRPDVILGCWAYPDGWAAVRLAREANLPAVIKVVGSDVLVGDRARRDRALEGLRQADAVVAVSRDLADQVISRGVSPDRVHVVYNGLDHRMFRPGDRDSARARLGLPADGSIVLFVGNLLMSKGAGVLAEALAILARRGPDAPRCVFVGRGRDESRLRAMLAGFGLAGMATLVGPRPLDELPDWYHACDLVALPSFSEGIPNVLLEASACARPFVATHVGGIPEIAGAAACRLVPPGDPEAVAGAIAEVLSWGPVPPPPTTSWDESARQLADVLRSAIQAPIGPSRTPC